MKEKWMVFWTVIASSQLLCAQDASPTTPAPTPPPPLVFPMKAGDWDTYSDTWGATDALNRTLPGHDKVGDPKEGKVIAMFCFMSNDEPNVPFQDHAKMLAENPHPDFNGVGWWGQPWFGYYINSDHAVIRKHIQMLADAGVDVMVMDNTNGVTYPQVRQAICEIMTEMRANCLKTPQIAFFSGGKSWKELQANFYGKNLYPDLVQMGRQAVDAGPSRTNSPRGSGKFHDS